MKPTYSVDELLQVINSAQSITELEQIRQVVDEDKDNYTLSDVRLLANFILVKLRLLD